MNNKKQIEKILIPMINKQVPAGTISADIIGTQQMSAPSANIFYTQAYGGHMFKAFSTYKYNSAVEILRMELRSLEYDSSPEKDSYENKHKRADTIRNFFSASTSCYKPKYNLQDLNAILSYTDFSTKHGIYSTENICDSNNYSGNDVTILENEDKTNDKVLYTMYVNFKLDTNRMIRVYGDCLFECLETFMDILYDRKDELQG